MFLSFGDAYIGMKVAFEAAGAGQLSPKMTVKVEIQVWSEAWTRNAAETDYQEAGLIALNSGLPKV